MQTAVLADHRTVFATLQKRVTVLVPTVRQMITIQEDCVELLQAEDAMSRRPVTAWALIVLQTHSSLSTQNVELTRAEVVTWLKFALV